MNDETGELYSREHGLLRGARRLRLVRTNGSTVRLAVLLALLCWVPVAVEFYLGASAGSPADTEEPFYSYFTMHVMSLLAIPLLVIGIGAGMQSLSGLFARFESMGLIEPPATADWRRLLESNAIARDRVLPWLFLAVFALVTFATREWRMEERFGEHADGGLWFFHFVRPLYAALAVCMLWRLLMVTRLAARIARLDLKLLVTHPDRTGGMGFFERVPVAFSPGILAISSVFAAQTAHQLLYHGATLAQIRLPTVGYALGILAIFLSPAFAVSPMLRRARRDGLKQYSALISRYGRTLHEHWIQGNGGRSPMFEAQELGAGTDAFALYTAVRSMKTSPIGRTAVIGIFVPVLAPLLAVVATQVPIREIVGDILKSVM